MPFERPVLINGGVYRHHRVTEIRHVVGSFTKVRVCSYVSEGSAEMAVRVLDRDFDDSLTVARAEEWVAGLPEFAEYVDARDELVGEIASMLTDEQALEVPRAYPEWAAGAQYAEGARVRRLGALYRVLQAHAACAGWEPEAAPSLFAPILAGQQGAGDDDGWPEWSQPDSTNPYMLGDRVSHGGAHWESDCDGNVWEPGVYGWHEVEDA